MSTTAAATGIVYNIPEVNSGTTTSWIPVTTPWPSLSGCASSFFLYPGGVNPFAWDPGYGYFASGTPRCLPPAATTWWEQVHQNGDAFTTLSIRPVVCPAAFTTADSSIQSGSSTLVVCCPSGYYLQNGEPGRAIGTCTSPLTPGQIITYLSSTSGGYVSTNFTITSSTMIQAVPFEGWNVATPTSGALSNSSSNPSSSSTSTSQSSCGLSPGAKAGIGVSATIGGIGILALIGAFVLLRRRPKVAQYDAVPPVRGLQAEAKLAHELGAQQNLAELSER